ncbi:MAG: hypothetical protein QXD43_02090 [Candidatus Aenigmatarchaeota archaeon]
MEEILNEKESLEKIKNFANLIKKDILSVEQSTLNQLNDPIVIGVLLFKLLEERENTNRLLKTLLQKIEILEQKIDKKTLADSKEIEKESEEKISNDLDMDLLPEQDQKIIQLIQERGKVCAADIKLHFNYKGENAASARLNRLFSLGILKKINVGKKVYFLLNK